MGGTKEATMEIGAASRRGPRTEGGGEKNAVGLPRSSRRKYSPFSIGTLRPMLPNEGRWWRASMVKILRRSTKAMWENIPVYSQVMKMCSILSPIFLLFHQGHLGRSL